VELAVTARFRVIVLPDLYTDVPLPAILHWLLESVPAPGVMWDEPVPALFKRYRTLVAGE
jgi:hypothetical protein